MDYDIEYDDPDYMDPCWYEDEAHEFNQQYQHWDSDDISEDI